MKNRTWRYGIGFTLAAGVSTLAAWSYGCSSDSSSSSGLGKPDPGGTFGVEALVHVTGAGRVDSDLGNINCPGTCTSIVLFDPSKGGTVTLTATTSTGWRFAGWAFDAIPVPARGRGSDLCQPILRTTATPQGVDATSNVIKLPAGELDGTAPQGQDCGGFTKVPTGYSMTAKFEQVDAGFDAGAEGPPLYSCPAGSTGQKIYVKNSIVYWQCDQGGGSHIYSAIAAGGGTVTSVASTASSVMTLFTISPSSNYAVYQNSGYLFANDVVNFGAPQLQFLPGESCAAVAIDPANLYCRGLQTESLYGKAWNGTTQSMTKLTNGGFGVGSDLAVDGPPAANVFYSDTSLQTIDSLPIGSFDGGTPGTPTILAANQSQTTATQIVGSTAVWQSSSGIVSAPKGGGQSTYVQNRTGIQSFVVDSIGTFYYLTGANAGQGAASIQHAVTSTTSTPVKTGLTNPVGIAVDGTYVYWLSPNGDVHRAQK
ncbi:MAG TPA: hypothetical protein VNO21_14640 [Polyangiaceae bacterium]|nr:hypothetical protein [Polyangiaceae bacterium]